MWELNLNGTLANSYSGLCATANTVKGDRSEIGQTPLYIGLIIIVTFNGRLPKIQMLFFQQQLKSALGEFARGLQQEEEVWLLT